MRDTRAGNRERERVGTLSRRWRLWQHVGVAVTHCCLARRDIPRHFASWYREIRPLQILTLRPRDGINKLARANTTFFTTIPIKSTKSCFQTDRCFSKNATSRADRKKFDARKMKPMTLKISRSVHRTIVMRNHSMNTLFARLHLAAVITLWGTSMRSGKLP